MYYISLFFLFSIIGYFYEHALNLLAFFEFHSGYFFGPWIPIYGFGILIILGVDYFLKKKNLNKLFEVCAFFIIVMILLSILEFIGGHLIHYFTGISYWDYSWAKFHFGKYIALEVAFIWGIFASVINYLVYPKIKKYLKKVPALVPQLLLLAFVSDIIITVITRNLTNL